MTTAELTEQRTKALECAMDKRRAMADLRARLASERGALADVMRDPPDAVSRMLVVDVVRMAHSQRSTEALRRLGHLAVRDGVNLLVPLGGASLRTREWVAQHAAWQWVPSPSGIRRRLRVIPDAA